VANRDTYDNIVLGEARDPYRVLIGLSEPIDVAARLQSAGISFEVDNDEFVVQRDDLPGSRCRLSTEEDEGFTRPDGRDLTAADIAALESARQKVGLEATLTRRWRDDVAALARLLTLIAPEMSGLYDFDSFRFWSSRWVRAVAGGRPITLSEMFETHGVASEDRLWAHTHGLRRLGLIDLEFRDDLDGASFDFAAKVINATANAMHASGVVPPETPIRVGTGTTVEWEPWESVEWDEGELGGPDDRDEWHSDPSGVLYPSSQEPPLAAGLVFNDPDDGWAVPEDGMRIFDELARATAAGAYEASRRREGRSMWVSAGPAGGVVDSFDNVAFAVVDEDGTRLTVPLESLDDWWVRCAANYSLGPWKAYNLPVIEEIAEVLRPTKNTEGQPLCSVCGTPLGPGHVCPN
jgi:hypothetical protein